MGKFNRHSVYASDCRIAGLSFLQIPAIAIVACVVILNCLCIVVDASEETAIAILSVAAIPRGDSADVKAAVFEYPDVASIDIAVTVRLDAESAKKVTLFVSGADQDGWKMGKGKVAEMVEPGEARLVLKDFINLKNFYGEHDVTLNVEVSVEGGRAVKSRRAFTFIGLPKPEFRMDYVDLRPRDEPLFLEFIPGESFSFNFFFQIPRNDAELDAQIRIFAVMDEQNFEIENYSISDPYWDETDFTALPGYYRIELFGRLPDRFVEYYKERHYFRLIVEVEFEGGIRYVEYGEGMIYDEFYGDNRNPYSISDAYIQMEQSPRWRIDKLDEDTYDKRIREFRELRRQRRFDLYY